MKRKRIVWGTMAALVLGGCATAKDPALERNKGLVGRYFDGWANGGDPAVAHELIAPNLLLRNPPATIASLEEYKTRMLAFHKAFPDARYTVEDRLAEGDRVAVRWTLRATQSGDYLGHPATGKSFAVTGTSTFRIAQGKIQEIVVNMDRLGMMEQLGWLAAAPPK